MKKVTLLYTKDFVQITTDDLNAKGSNVLLYVIAKELLKLAIVDTIRTNIQLHEMYYFFDIDEENFRKIIPILKI